MPWRQALRIWSELRGSSSAEALLDQQPIAPAEAADFRAAIERRVAGEPLAHVTGWAGFRHLLLRSDRRALIPRPETEGLVDLLLPRVRSGTVVDVGTGSGCLALSLAQEGEFNLVIGVDCSTAALTLASCNRQLIEAGKRVSFVRADLCGSHQP